MAEFSMHKEWTKNTFFKFSPEISCQLEQVEFLEGKCLADCVRLLQLTLGVTSFFISSLEKEEKRKEKSSQKLCCLFSHTCIAKPRNKSTGFWAILSRCTCLEVEI